MEAVDKLKELTNGLPPVPKLRDLVVSNSNAVVEYEVEDGHSVGKALLYKNDVAVQDLLLTKGAAFPPHKHDEQIEYGIIYKGKIEVIQDNKKKIYKPGNCITFKKGKTHSGKALEATGLIAVAIPKIDGYPKI